MTRLPMLITLAAALLLAVPASAHEPPPRQGHDGQRFKERMTRMRGQILRNRVGLDDATAQQIEAELARLDPERRKLHQRKQQARRGLRQLIESDSNDQDAYTAALAEMRAVQKALSSLRERQFSALSGMLTPKQQARMFMAMQRMQRRMRRGVKRGMKRGMKRDQRRQRRQRRGPRGDHWQGDPGEEGGENI